MVVSFKTLSSTSPKIALPNCFFKTAFGTADIETALNKDFSSTDIVTKLSEYMMDNVDKISGFHLQAGVAYTFTVTAFNANGSGDQSQHSNDAVFTGIGAPPAPTSTPMPTPRPVSTPTLKMFGVPIATPKPVPAPT